MLPKYEAVRPKRALRTFPDVSEATASGADNLTESQSALPMPANLTHAKFERAPANGPKQCMIAERNERSS
jgi:hypothetical protein